MPVKFIKNLSLPNVREILKVHQKGNFSAIPQNALSSPLIKGIYLWYMRPEATFILSKYLDMPIGIEEQVLRLDDKILIYIGTAGARLTENNLGHIRQRLTWHICTKHRPSTIINGTLSTLRTTLGALLSSNLIISDGIQTEDLINSFMKEYLFVGYLEYEGDASDVINSINEDEKFLIKFLKPLLNIKNNPNARLERHPTKAIKERRRLINKHSKNSLKA